MADMINHPPHYNRDGRKECIDEMIEIFGIEYVRHYCLLNAYKYNYRHDYKNGIEDIGKMVWYKAKYFELGGTEEEYEKIHTYDK